MGTTTSPQQQNPQAGADKDPCEVLLSMLYPRLFTTKSHVSISPFASADLFLYQISLEVNLKLKETLQI